MNKAKLSAARHMGKRISSGNGIHLVYTYNPADEKKTSPLGASF
jgi:hypothetical protein